MHYAEVFPTSPILNSEDMTHISAAALMSVRYFQAEPDTMPEEVFSEHHVLLNFNAHPMRVQNKRNGELRDFEVICDDIILTPAGMRSGWRWFGRSDVIVITLDPVRVEKFALTELGILLDRNQLADLPYFSDPDLCAAGAMLREAITNDDMTSGVMFEAMSRVFLVKLLQRYGKTRNENTVLSAKFTSSHYQRVLAHIRSHFDQTISVDDLAAQAGMSAGHFSRVFKKTLGETPMQYLLAYRIEQAIDMMEDVARPLGDIAFACGFSDQAHFSRCFKQVTGQTPREHRTR